MAEQIIGAPLAMETKTIVAVHLLTGLPFPDILRNLNKIQIISSYEFARIGSETFKLNNSYIKIANDKVYTKTPINDLAISLAAQYTDLVDTMHGELDDVLMRYEDYSNAISNTFLRIQNGFETIRSLTYKKITVFNEKEFIKACRKNKAFAEFTKKTVNVIIPNVKVGNELEGYLHYKKVVVTLEKKSLCVQKIKFYFSTFDISSEEIRHMGNTPLHPHILGNFCWGNRQTDYELYREAHAYIYLIDVIVESVKSYNPEGPFNSVKQIASNIYEIKKKVDSMRQAGISFESDKAHNLQVIWNALPKCEKCYHVLPENNECMNNHCKANPNASDINCRRCSHSTAKMEFNEKLNQYLFKCTNSTCLTNLQHIHLDVSCPACGTNSLFYEIKGRFIDKAYCSCIDPHPIIAVKKLNLDTKTYDWITIKDDIDCIVKGCSRKLIFNDINSNYVCPHHDIYNQRDCNGEIIKSFLESYTIKENYES